jgi:hypothetical protein
MVLYDECHSYHEYGEFVQVHYEAISLGTSFEMAAM